MPAHHPLARSYRSLHVDPRPVQTVRDAGAAGGTAYTTALSASSGASGAPVTVTVTPNGFWAAGLTATASAAGLTGTFAQAVKTPAADTATALTFSYTPSAAGSGTISVAVPGMTNTSGARAYTAT